MYGSQSWAPCGPFRVPYVRPIDLEILLSTPAPDILIIDILTIDIFIIIAILVRLDLLYR